jgi:hypothetical protein
MDYDYFWGDNDSDGHVMAKAHDLESPPTDHVQL